MNLWTKSDHDKLPFTLLFIVLIIYCLCPTTITASNKKGINKESLPQELRPHVLRGDNKRTLQKFAGRDLAEIESTAQKMDSRDRPTRGSGINEPHDRDQLLFESRGPESPSRRQPF